MTSLRLPTRLLSVLLGNATAQLANYFDFINQTLCEGIMLFMWIQYAFVVYMVGLPTHINLTSLSSANHFYRPKGVFA